MIPEKNKNSKAIDCIFIKQSLKQRDNKKVIEVWIIDNGITEQKK